VAKGTTRSAPAANAKSSSVTTPSTTSAPSATASAAASADKPKDSGLKPIDRAAVQAKTNAMAAAAASECASQKKPENKVETFSGNVGFRPDGSGSGFMQGVGGAQMCVRKKMLYWRIGKYAHPDEWHVESFKWSVTVK
jgi:hypothetical protein